MEEQTRRFDNEDQPTRRFDEVEGDNGLGRCPKCGGEVLLLQAGMDNQNGHLAVKRLDVWIGVLSGGITQVMAHTCANCGFTEFYAKDPAAVLPRD